MKPVAELTNVGIEPTNRCNLKCGICYSHSSPRPKGFMDPELFGEIIGEVNTIPTVTAVGLYLGGEPFMHPNFIDMLDSLPPYKKRNFGVVVSTNAMLLDEEKMQALVRNGINRLHVSLDGIGARHEEKRKGSNYETVVRNIERLTELKHGRRYFPGISVNMVISDQNEPEIDEFVNTWIDKVNIIILDAATNDRFQYAALEKLPERIRNIPESPTCYYAFNYLGIMWNGDTLPCCCDLEGKNTLGNVRKEGGVLKAFNSKKMKAFRKMHLKGSFPSEHICASCDIGKRFLHDYLYNPAGFEKEDKQ